MVGTEPRFKIHQAPDATINGQKMKIFQYLADAEDEVCKWETILDFGFFSIKKPVSVKCYGEVWTDEDIDILRISQRLELHGRWNNTQSVVTYGWLKQKEEAPRLIPVTIAMQAEMHNKIYWCRGFFKDYHIFDSHVRIATN
jgi:hypothetical protein